ncbi:MAG: acetoacetate--CoA ligase [Gammaproteobacteria bacterium]|nr:acetoacetate--CoA ligase [Gammaproteobacteria bacterium]
MQDTEILWAPDDAHTRDCRMADFMHRVEATDGVDLGGDYAALWQWSVDNPAAFWDGVWRYFDVVHSRPAEQLLQDPDAMPGARWFVGARLNFAENLLRYRDARTAILFSDEQGSQETLSYATLYAYSARLAGALQRLGVGPGDRVAAVLPNRPEAIVGMLATSWLGAIWSSCSPDFGSDGILDRFGQIRPKVLIAVDGYRFKGRTIAIGDKIAACLEQLPSVEHAIGVDWQGTGLPPGMLAWTDLPAGDATPPPFAQVAFDDPLYILFSSGTTGTPKCIVHGVGGTLLQHLKELGLHTDIDRDDRLFYFTTCGWMMWNWLASGLALGCTLVLFDGNPFHPGPSALLDLAERTGVSVFGTSAKYIDALHKAGFSAVGTHPLTGLRTLLSTGSPLSPESFDYIATQLKPGVQICSISGGTDIVSCFALGSPLLPVYRGELQCRGLGLDVDVFDDGGHSVRNQEGELVCKRPFPSMPVGFWDDADGSRYRAAYFERFPGIWTHGDWATLTERGGLVIQGRSDAVLNPGGVRIGTAEIYRQVERLPEIVESIAIGQRWDDDVRIVLFVVLRDGAVLDDALRARIRERLKTHASPRHVPAKILQVGAIPRTRSGKITELAVRDTVEGRAVKNTEALLNPDALAEFANRAELQD